MSRMMLLTGALAFASGVCALSMEGMFWLVCCCVSTTLPTASNDDGNIRENKEKSRENKKQKKRENDENKSDDTKSTPLAHDAGTSYNTLHKRKLF